jgi:hypothetical protein
MAARMRVLDRSPDRKVRSTTDLQLAHDAAVLLGRGVAHVGVGIDPVDSKVSRLALKVTRTSDGWQISAANRNGVLAFPWGQASFRIDRHLVLAWPRLALQVIGSPAREHWVLLEDDTLAVPRASSNGDGEAIGSTTTTEAAKPPTPLTEKQATTLRTLFAELLAWPPVVPATTLQIKQVAHRLQERRPETIQRRLELLRQKANRLEPGLAVSGPLTNPDYLYVLVRNGYLQPCAEDVLPGLMP